MDKEMDTQYQTPMKKKTPKWIQWIDRNWNRWFYSDLCVEIKFARDSFPFGYNDLVITSYNEEYRHMGKNWYKFQRVIKR